MARALNVMDDSRMRRTRSHPQHAACRPSRQPVEVYVGCRYGKEDRPSEQGPSPRLVTDVALHTLGTLCERGMEEIA